MKILSLDGLATLIAKLREAFAPKVHDHKSRNTSWGERTGYAVVESYFENGTLFNDRAKFALDGHTHPGMPRVYVQPDEPTDPNVGDIWVKPIVLASSGGTITAVMSGTPVPVYVYAPLTVTDGVEAAPAWNPVASSSSSGGTKPTIPGL